MKIAYHNSDIYTAYFLPLFHFYIPGSAAIYPGVCFGNIYAIEMELLYKLVDAAGITEKRYLVLTFSVHVHPHLGHLKSYTLVTPNTVCPTKFTILPTTAPMGAPTSGPRGPKYRPANAPAPAIPLTAELLNLPFTFNLPQSGQLDFSAIIEIIRTTYVDINLFI